MTRSNIVDVEGVIKAETAKAVLLEAVQTGEEGWLPKSQIEVHRDEGKDIVVVSAPEWLAQDKGLI